VKKETISFLPTKQKYEGLEGFAKMVSPSRGVAMKRESGFFVRGDFREGELGTKKKKGDWEFFPKGGHPEYWELPWKGSMSIPEGATGKKKNMP